MDTNDNMPGTVDARQQLEELYKDEFNSEIGATALALGREDSEITEILDGTGEIDGDLSMKIHALAQERLDQQEGSANSG